MITHSQHITRVVHIYHSRYDIYIGRGSKWGNPFHIGVDGNRAEVCKKYKEYISKRPDLISQLKYLKDKTLGCWCKTPQFPDRLCHGDILIELIEEHCEL